MRGRKDRVASRLPSRRWVIQDGGGRSLWRRRARITGDQAVDNPDLVYQKHPEAEAQEAGGEVDSNFRFRAR